VSYTAVSKPDTSTGRSRHAAAAADTNGSHAMTATVEEASGQHAVSGPGFERKYTTRVAGPEPSRAELRLSGAGNLEWDGPQLERQGRYTLTVEIVVTKIALEDKLDPDGYVTQTTRAHTAAVESARLADEHEAT